MTITITKPLEIGYKKTCNCPPNHLNCMTPKEWIKSQIGVWEFYYEKRDIRDKKIHPAVFPIALAKQVISLFTHRGELVVDPFVGTGTTLVAAKDLDRNAVGFDIYPKYIEICKKRLGQERLIETSQQIAILDDARNIDQYFKPNTISLVWTSPPYANLLNRPRLNKSRRGDLRENEQYLKIEQYGFDKRDLGLLSAEEYQKEMTLIFRKILPLLKPGGHAVINIPDMWWRENKPGGGRRIPLHIHVYHALIDAGYEFRNTIIWNRNNIVNKVGIFGWPSNYITMGTTFEYILDFWKPP